MHLFLCSDVVIMPLLCCLFFPALGLLQCQTAHTVPLIALWRSFSLASSVLLCGTPAPQQAQSEVSCSSSMFTHAHHVLSGCMSASQLA